MGLRIHSQRQKQRRTKLVVIESSSIYKQALHQRENKRINEQTKGSNYWLRSNNWRHTLNRHTHTHTHRKQQRPESPTITPPGMHAINAGNINSPPKDTSSTVLDYYKKKMWNYKWQTVTTPVVITTQQAFKEVKAEESGAKDKG